MSNKVRTDEDVFIAGLEAGKAYVKSADFSTFVRSYASIHEAIDQVEQGIMPKVGIDVPEQYLGELGDSWIAGVNHSLLMGLYDLLAETIVLNGR